MAHTDMDELLDIIGEEDNIDDLPVILPLLPVRDVVVFTDMLLPLVIGRDKSMRAVDEAVAKKGYLLLTAQRNKIVEEPNSDELYTMGTVGKILRVLKMPDGRLRVLVQGVAKAKIIKYVLKKTLFRVKVEIIEEQHVDDITMEIEALMRNVREHSARILAIRGDLTNDVGAILETIEGPGKLANLVASNLRIKIEEAQILLEDLDPVNRLKSVNGFLSHEFELSTMQAKIQSEVNNEISKNQKNYFLREQLRAINKELGDDDEKAKEISEYEKKIKEAKMSNEANKEALKQLKRFEQMYPDSAESSVVRTYLDWLVDMPWSKSTSDEINIKKAKQVLNKNHYGLDKIKDRILEYLSVRKLKAKIKGPIICFVGPPGVGKTSLGKAIADAMGRKFIRISLGGIRDEAEIRGHRRTYIGALPGRILQGLKQAKTNNPVFMLDEIDKLGSDFRGDPSSALLEALDPEQNFAFSDHYLNLTFDLSNVMFILTANLTDTIPSALLDRMEVISLSGYSEEEKTSIARKFLMPRQVEENGLEQKDVSLTPPALLQVIREHTLEAGLRNLERELGTICRKIARKIAEGDEGTFTVTKNNLQDYLGVRKYYPEMELKTSQVGMATGLAWTQAGGEVLYIETSLLPGKGELILTGQLGDVMQESARTALSFARANIGSHGIEENFLETMDVHIHVPAGAIPKDGPSAGIVMATALISAITGQPVSKDVAMTGEITLRGSVLPIGGLKEKALGALRAGIHTIVLPEKNEKDLIEIPKNIKDKIKFIPVKDMNQVLKIAIEKK
ncbi:MAG TPA: endopeptidase La [Desulfobacteraceae bacterium]|nr:endopeptidase La [Desulfobacteraceae bacterium]